ncbi:hypothetical protein PT2222_140332 [Paraburkholderia tropica]
MQYKKNLGYFTRFFFNFPLPLVTKKLGTLFWRKNMKSIYKKK